MPATEVPVNIVHLEPRQTPSPDPPRTDGAARRGNDPAELFRTLAPAVLGYLRAQHVADPEDLLGEVFVHVVRDVDRFDGDAAAVRRWVFSIAHNRMVDAGRRNRRRPPPVPMAPDVLGVMAQPSEVVWPDPDPELVNALRDLTDVQRDVVVLRFVADLPIQDVATILRRRAGAVKALQRRALARLANLLAP
jgi:RNA polymerase sigma-70 factor (ECF subfamily)